MNKGAQIRLLMIGKDRIRYCVACYGSTVEHASSLSCNASDVPLQNARSQCGKSLKHPLVRPS
jgi:hypothetical protein